MRLKTEASASISFKLSHFWNVKMNDVQGIAVAFRCRNICRNFPRNTQGSAFRALFF